ncbi:flagellar type III secretion system protein FliR [Paenibacillus rhizovicinus]|uniref:Flagellar biosynthetic protein FliR n=1 Tax=Paenibacillus rhizovicinus TaxID=2704463 RepID=A0A6C0NWF3_9BACL|nr:flagellar biosynthetic protein FliR [Paenibacillus rhizovicinus]QHW30053.1 flagellar type III secretion system protein FliR [Paenibacillus rhizovicinus]
MELFLQGFPIFLLIFCRITAFFVVAPIFSTRNVPNTFKIGFSFFVSFLVFLTYGMKQTIVPDAEYILAIIRESLAGALLGFTAYLFFTIINTAGSFIDMQMGFGMANIIDPMTGASAPLMGNFKGMIATLIFLSINGHHYLLSALLQSYDWIPISNTLFLHMKTGSITTFLTSMAGQTFMLALQMSAPLVVAMFLTDVGLGFLARTAPQYNVFVIGMPIKILVGFLMMAVLMPGLVTIYGHIFEQMFSAMQKLLSILQGPAA